MRSAFIISFLALAACEAAAPDRDPMMDGRAAANIGRIAGPMFAENIEPATQCILESATPGEVQALAEAADRAELEAVLGPISLRPELRDCARAYMRANA